MNFKTFSNQSLSVFFDLTWRLFVRNIRSAHRKSVLGLVWLVIPPLVNTGVWVLLHANGIIRYDEQASISYPVFALTGIIFWQVFLDALQVPFQLMEKYQDIIKYLRFNHLALMGASILEAAFNVFIRLSLLTIFLILLGAPFHWSMLLAFYPLLVLLVLGFALSMCIMPFYLMYRDVPRLIGFGTQFAFFVTPIVYAMPETGWFARFGLLNPISSPLILARDLIIYGQSNFWLYSTFIFGIAILLFMLGVKVFRITCLRMVERI